MKRIKSSLTSFLTLMGSMLKRLLRPRKTQKSPAAPSSLSTPPSPSTPSTPSTLSSPTTPSSPQSPSTPLTPSPTSTYRADAINFNEQFLNRHYRLRYNTMKRTTEYQSKAEGEAALWQPLTERDLNRLTVEQLKEGGQSWSYGMKLYVESSCVPDFNPVASYLDSCPEWDRQRDYIGELARRVPTAYAQWPDFFHRWMLALVAQARGMSRDYGNGVVPLLIGPQGTRKSTFCKNILPREMRDYYMDDIKMENAEQVERVLGRMWLVCIDEYDAKTTREQAKIKRILTEKDVQMRRMRSDQYVMTPRMASFIATTNERQPLGDPTGSRRYLCVEVEGIIDTETPIDHRQLFAQALWELDHGHPYYFSKEEEASIVEHNRPYQALSAIDELLTAYYEPAEVDKDSLLQATDILADLQQRVKGPDRPTMHQLIQALKNQSFHHGAQRGRHGWYARKR